MDIHRVTIEELEAGWVIVEGDRRTTCKTAAGALRSIQRRGKSKGTTNAYVITWCPSTKVGRLVVRALTS